MTCLFEAKFEDKNVSMKRKIFLSDFNFRKDE